MFTGKHLSAHSFQFMAGNKEVVKIKHYLGHCETYDKLLDIETAKAQKVVKLMHDIPIYHYYHGNHVNVDFCNHNVAFYDKKKHITTCFEKLTDDSSVCQSQFSCRLFVRLYLGYSNHFKEQVYRTLSGIDES